MNIKKEEIHYIDNDPENGFVVDYDKVNYYFDQLKVPADVWTPRHIDLYKADWVVAISKRSRGKTTNVILYNLIIYLMYGSIVPYVRSDDTELKMSFIQHMFEVILQFKYIDKLTNAQYNSVYYHAKHFYLCHLDEDGNRDVTDNKPFMICVSLTMSEDVKSTLNLPLSVHALYDEFMRHTYRTDEFIELCQLLSTIRRDRLHFKVFMLSNMNSPYNQYLKELDIMKFVQKMEPGTWDTYTANRGARLHVEYIADDYASHVKDKKLSAAIIRRAKTTAAMFGFSNPKLKSIVGGGWDFNNYPHLPKRQKDEQRAVVNRDIYLIYYDRVICMELSRSSRIGTYVNCREYTGALRRGTIKFVLTEPSDQLEFYGWGSPRNRVCRLVWNLYSACRFFYSDNEVGRIVEEFVENYRTNRKLLR